MAKARQASAVPLYQKVKDHVVGRILAGKIAAGERVPSENELTRKLKVSRMTAHRALRELTAEGWLLRIQGAGSFVADGKPQSELLRVRSIREEIAERGHRHSCRVVLLKAEAAPRLIAEALALKPPGRVFHSLLLHRENEVPIQLEERHVNPAFAPRYLEQDFARSTPNEYLTALGPIQAADHVIEAVLPTARQRSLLGIEADEPCLRVTRMTWSGGLVVSVTRLTHPGSRYRLVGHQEEIVAA
ncbi:MAG: histidine utilization repressor [Kiloniellales bacterium]